MSTLAEPLVDRSSREKPEGTRPIFVRHVPESLWLKIHYSALQHRMSLQQYIVQLLRECEDLTA